MADRPRWVPRWAARLWGAPLSVLLIAIGFPIFVMVARDAPIVDITLIEHGAAARDRIAGEPWRLVSAMFLHSGYVALLWNAVFGLRWMALTEGRLGKLRFFALYLAFGIASTSVGLLLHDIPIHGASGAILGLIGDRFVRWGVEMGSFKRFFKDINMRMTLLIALAWVLLGSFAGFDNYTNAAGLFIGCIFGAVTAMLAKKKTVGAGSSDGGAPGA